MLITKDYDIYHMPCGDACSTTPPPVDSSDTVPDTTTAPPVDSSDTVSDTTTAAPVASSAIVPVTTTTTAEFTYVGCFADTLDGRVFTGGEFASAGMTSEVRRFDKSIAGGAS